MLGLILSLALADERVQVVLVDRDLPPGSRIRYADVDTQLRPPALVPDHVAREPGQVVGQVSVDWLYRGQLLRTDRVLETPADGPAALLPRGMALHELALGPRTWPRPGDVVDLYDATAGCVLAEGVRVLGARTVHGKTVTDRTRETLDRWFLAIEHEDLPGVLGTESLRPLLRGPTDLGPTELPTCD